MKPDEQIKEIENWLWEQLGENQPSEKERYRVMATISDAGAQISRLIQKTRADTLRKVEKIVETFYDKTKKSYLGDDIAQRIVLSLILKELKSEKPKEKDGDEKRGDK